MHHYSGLLISTIQTGHLQHSGSTMGCRSTGEAINPASGGMFQPNIHLIGLPVQFKLVISQLYNTDHYRNLYHCVNMGKASIPPDYKYI